MTRRLSNDLSKFGIRYFEMVVRKTYTIFLFNAPLISPGSTAATVFLLGYFDDILNRFDLFNKRRCNCDIA